MTRITVEERVMQAAALLCVRDAQVVYAAASIHSSRTPER